MNGRRVCGMGWVAWAVLMGTAGAWAQTGALQSTIGVLAGPETARYIDRAENTAAYLETKIPDTTFEVRVLPADKLAEALQNGGVSVALVDPVRYVRFERALNVMPLATCERYYLGKSNRRSGGVLFVLNDRADLKRPEDLKGGTLAVTGEETIGWLAVRRAFRDRDFDPFERCKLVRNLPGEEAVVAEVLRGGADAGVLSAGALEALSADGRVALDRLRVIVFDGSEADSTTRGFPYLISTRAYPEWLAVASPHAPRELTRGIAAALLTMPLLETDDAWKARPGSWTIPCSYIAVHDALRDLALEPYQQHGRIPFGEVLRRYIYLFLGLGIVLVLLALALSYILALNRALRQEMAERKANP